MESKSMKVERITPISKMKSLLILFRVTLKSERKKTGWILEGFPRTRLQALALQNMRIIPDKVFMLNIADSVSYEKLN